MRTVPLNNNIPFRDMAFNGYGIELRPVTPCDLPSLRRWRNSPEISKHMTNSYYISPHQQRIWYESIRARIDQVHWVVWNKEIRTGYASIKGEGPIDSQEKLEVGFYVGDSPVRHGLLGYAIEMLLLDIAFEHMSASQILGEIVKTNYSARKLAQQLGYREISENENFVDVVLDPADYKTAKIKFVRYFSNARCELFG